jgi:hypothetical protein
MTLLPGDLIRILRDLAGQVGTDEFAVLRIVATDPVDWSAFPPTPTCTLPGIDRGQVADIRYAIAESEQGLHLQPDGAGHVDAHLDNQDGCRRTLSHLVQETRFVEGAASGALVGLVAGLLTRDARLAVALTAVGAGVGGAVGGNTPRRQEVIFMLRDLLV